MSTHNLCFEQKYEKYQRFYLKIFNFLEVKLSIYLNRRVFVMTVVLLVRLASFGQLGLNSGPQIKCQEYQNGLSDNKGPGNINFTIV